MLEEKKKISDCEKPEKNLCRHQIYDIYISFKKKKSTWNQLTKLELYYTYACEAFKGQQHYPPWILSTLSTCM